MLCCVDVAAGGDASEAELGSPNPPAGGGEDQVVGAAAGGGEDTMQPAGSTAVSASPGTISQHITHLHASVDVSQPLSVQTTFCTVHPVAT